MNDRKEGHWQKCFVAMMPDLQQRLRSAFHYLDPESMDEAVEEGLVHCLLSYARLHSRGRENFATPSTLAWYSSRQVKRGRPAAGRMNSKEPLSRYAQLCNGIQVQRLDAYSRKGARWIDTIVADKRTPIADQVAAKLDITAWLRTMTRRMRQIAKDLAFGFSTSEVAEKHGVTASRISQLRRSLEKNWRDFEKDGTTA